MKHLPFGNTGHHVSEICLGTMMFGGRCDEAEADRILGRALEAGVNFVDTAAMYCEGLTEEIMGRLLKNRREKVFLATKVHQGVDAQSIVGGLEASLRRLQTESVDLYMIHWPKKGMKPQEIMEALHNLVAQGKTRLVGCCNYPAWLFANSNAIAQANKWTPLVCNQVPYNLIERGVEVEILPQAQAEGFAITAYRPLLMGLLAGKYRPGDPPPADSRGKTDTRITDWLTRYHDSISNFLKMAEECQVPPSVLAVAWVSHLAAVTCPIIGVSSLKQLESQLDSLEFRLTGTQYDRLSAIFDTEVKEEAGGDYKALRRELHLIGN